MGYDKKFDKVNEEKNYEFVDLCYILIVYKIILY